MKILEKVAKANRIRKEKGLRGVKQSLWRLYRHYSEKKKYQKWIKTHQITDEKRQQILTEIESFQRTPKISVVMPVYDVAEKWLRICIESVLHQLYENWELCIADDCSPSPHIRKILEEYAEKDNRIKVVFRPENGHISAASNSALELATGEFCVLLDHDDELSEDALFYVAKELNEFSDMQMIYSDEDLIDERGRRFQPKFKPDFSRDLMYSLNLITHLSAYRTELLRKIGGFRLGAEGSQDYDLALRVIEEIDENQGKIHLATLCEMFRYGHPRRWLGRRSWWRRGRRGTRPWRRFLRVLQSGQQMNLQPFLFRSLKTEALLYQLRLGSHG